MDVKVPAFSHASVFLQRQERDWKITVIRTSLDKFAYQIVFPYLSIYIVALGASMTQLGAVNSLGLFVAACISPLTGWFIDQKGPKKIYLIGIGFLALCYLSYGIAQTWYMAIAAMVAYWLGQSVSIHSCAAVCGTCLANEDRATGMTICETVAAGLLGMLGPMLGAWLVVRFGGVNVSGIRVLFFFSLVFTLSGFVLIVTQLSDRKVRKPGLMKPNPFRDLAEVMKEGRHLKRWLIIAAVNQLPLGMILPFSQVYAHKIKGADPFILGAMVTGSALMSIIFAVPLGRLADSVGRKRVLYITIPLFWLSNIMLVWSPNPIVLLIAGVLQGFYYIGTPISAAIERELVPPDQMGRWIGIARFCRLFTNAWMALVAGLIWDKVGPQFVFLAFILIDLSVRVPLLAGMPETLTLRLRGRVSS